MVVLTKSIKEGPTMRNNTFKRIFTAVLTIAALAAGHTSAWAQDPASIGSINYNNTLGAYEINCAYNLHDLAVYVNGAGDYTTSGSETTAHNCEGLTFKMTADIDIPHNTEWNDANSTEDNYMAIGGYVNSSWKYFKGTFDGQNHTVSGIRINITDYGKGLFGAIQNALVKNVNLSGVRIQASSSIGPVVGSASAGSTVSGCQVTDAFIAGGSNYGGRLGGIVGSLSGSTVSDCHVSATVTICATVKKTNGHGGVVGESSSTSSITGCTSSATLSIAGVTDCYNFGGIVGKSYNTTITNCRALGVTVPATNDGHYDTSGAIAGDIKNATLNDNYYLNCNVAGTANAVNIGIGCNESDTSDHTGGTHSLHTATLESGMFISGTNVIIGSDIYYPSGKDMTLGGGTGYTVTVDGTNPVTYVQVTETAGVYTFTMPSGNITVSGAPDFAGLWHADGDHDGTTAERAYIITTTDGLNLLASLVNNGNNFSGKYFKLGDNITFAHTTDWDDASSTENNYVAIGKSGNISINFCGIFDGCGYTVSGIRISRGGDHDQGLFGVISNATVKNITLSDARITGNQNVAGIVGKSYGSTVDNCTVTGTVAIHAVVDVAQFHGGIVGFNSKASAPSSTVTGCTSSARLTGANGLNNTSWWGGIVGYNNGSGAQVLDCFATGVIIEDEFTCGAIVGDNTKLGGSGTDTGTLSGNYYSNCNINGKYSNAGVGVGGSSVDQDGAKGIGGITSGDYVSVTGSTVTFRAATYYLAGQNITLSHGDRTGYSFDEYTVSVDAPLPLSTIVVSDSHFTMPAADVTVTATWAADASMDITATSATVFEEAKYVTTFYHGTLDYQLPEGARAYTANLTGSTVIFHQIGDDGSVIPHGTAVIVVADAANITLTKLDSTDITAYAGSILQGSDAAFAKPAGTVYVLGVAGEPAALGFYSFTGSTIPAGKAYYVVE